MSSSVCREHAVCFAGPPGEGMEHLCWMVDESKCTLPSHDLPWSHLNSLTYFLISIQTYLYHFSLFLFFFLSLYLLISLSLSLSPFILHCLTHDLSLFITLFLFLSLFLSPPPPTTLTSHMVAV